MLTLSSRFLPSDAGCIGLTGPLHRHCTRRLQADTQTETVQYIAVELTEQRHRVCTSSKNKLASVHSKRLGPNTRWVGYKCKYMIDCLQLGLHARHTQVGFTIIHTLWVQSGIALIHSTVSYTNGTLYEHVYAC